jgi:hypothetical protein
MELSYDHIPVHVGGNPSRRSEASGHAIYEFHAKAHYSDKIFYWRQDDDVPPGATRARV